MTVSGPSRRCYGFWRGRTFVEASSSCYESLCRVAQERPRESLFWIAALVSRDAFLDLPSTQHIRLRPAEACALEQLRNELNKHFQSLRNELLELINRTSTTKQPLKVLREDIAGVQDAVVEQMRALQGKLDERKELAEQRSYLQLFINIATVVQHIEERLRSDEWRARRGRPAGIDDLDFYLKRAKDLPFARSLDTVLFIEKTIRDRLEETFAAGLESGDQQNLVRKLWVQPAMQKIIRKERFERANEGLAAIYDDIIATTLIELTGGESAQSSSGASAASTSWRTACGPSGGGALQRDPFVFATGIPDSFHQNYLLSMAFLDRVERFCKTRESVQAFRNHAAYSRFLRRWGLRVYFQLRFYEVSSKLDAALSRGVEVLASPSPAGYRLDAGAAVEEATERCLAPEVFLPMLAHQFAKLALHLAPRRRSGVGRPRPEQYILAYHDTELLLTRFQSRVPAALRKRMEALSGKLPRTSASVRPRLSPFASHLPRVLPELSKIITSHVLSKCLENLQASWTLAAVTSVADRYNEMTTELITTVRKTESSLKRLQAKKPAAGPAAPASAQAMGDTDKICLQLYLDVEELGRLMKKLGVEAASLASFASLHDLVYAESEKFLPLLAQQAPPAAP
eukprot:tig00020554_g10790.t1